MPEQTIYLLRPTTRRDGRGRQRSGFTVVRLTRIGQRYTDRGGEVYEPEYVYSAQDLFWSANAKDALESIKQKFPEAVEPWNGLRHATFTGSEGGPGWYPLDPDGGPLFAAVGDRESIPPTLLPPIRS